MISQLAPAFAKTSIEAKQDDLMLQQGSWVQFDKDWPSGHAWASGKLFVVSETPVMVDFPMSYKIAGGDYIDVNLAPLPTGFSSTVLNLYPASEGILYEVAIGFKKYEFFAQIGIPAAPNYIFRLGQSVMNPNINDPILKYLGNKSWKDSPDSGPLLKVYTIYNMIQVYLRLYALEGKNFEKCSVIFQVNKLRLQQIVAPTPLQLQQATLIRWYENLTKY